MMITNIIVRSALLIFTSVSTAVVAVSPLLPSLPLLLPHLVLLSPKFMVILNDVAAD